MRKLSAVLALSMAAVIAAPAQAQLIERAGGILTGRTDGRVPTRTDGRVDARTGDVYGRSGTSSRVPPGHLPPAGMCRVWIEGVPPGHQPKPTSCANAEAERFRIGGNARVIYGDRTAHPGKGRSAAESRRSTWPTEIDGRRTDRNDDGRWERTSEARKREAKARAEAAKDRQKAAKKQAKARGKAKGRSRD